MASGVHWKNGRPVDRAAVELRNRAQSFKEESREALAISVKDGEERVREYLEAATTNTGRKRVELGGVSAGRHDTGTMVNAVDSNGDHLRVEGATTWGDFGWFSGHFQQYFRDQDEGAGSIPAARALSRAYIHAREGFRRRMTQVARGKRPSR